MSANATSTQLSISPEQATARAQHLLRNLVRDARIAFDRACMGSCPVAEMNAAVESCKQSLEAVRAWSQVAAEPRR